MLVYNFKCGEKGSVKCKEIKKKEKKKVWIVRQVAGAGNPVFQFETPPLTTILI